MSGKGSARRPGNNEAYRTIWDRVFGKREQTAEEVELETRELLGWLDKCDIQKEEAC